MALLGERWHAPLAFVITLALGACATPTVVPERAHSGRFVATAEQGDQRSSVSGRFTIEVRADQQLIELASPIGTTMARVEISPGRASATGPQMQTETGPDADVLVTRLFGWRLPVRGLADWIDGRPDPSRPARVERDGDRITRIDQDGWTIRIAEIFPASSRPRLLLMDRPPSAGDPAVSVRLVVDDPAS
jgi:outer membrane lipoprotein LolB